MKEKDLKARWASIKTSSPDTSPFGVTSEGLKDFRGVPFPQTLKGKRFRGADLSFVDAAGCWIEGCVFEDCVVNKGQFQDVAEHHNKFHSCQFIKSNFSRSGLGYSTTWYDRCVFDRCQFSGAVFRNAIFSQTTFSNMKLKGIDFNASGFWDCTFTGELYDVWFKGTYQVKEFLRKHTPVETGLHRVDFRGASMKWITVSDGCALEGLLLPEGVVIVDMAVLKQRFDGGRLGEQFTRVEKEAIKHTLAINPHIDGQPQVFLSRPQLVEQFGEPLAASLFGKVVQVCGVSGSSVAARRG